MQRGSYFQSQEAENAAKWKMYEDYRAAKERLGVLMRAAKEKGKQFQEFGSVMSFTPSALSVEAGAITMNAETADLRQISYPATLFDFAAISVLLNDIRDTRSELFSLTETLKNSGMDFKE